MGFGIAKVLRPRHSGGFLGQASKSRTKVSWGIHPPSNGLYIPCTQTIEIHMILQYIMGHAPIVTRRWDNYTKGDTCRWYNYTKDNIHRGGKNPTCLTGIF